MVEQPDPVDLTAPSATELKERRYQTARLFVTFPRCGMTPAAVAAAFVEKWGDDVLALLVTSEGGKSGEHPHIHLWVVMRKEKFSFSFSSLDKLTGKRGNYQKMRRVRNCFDYLLKEQPQDGSDPPNGPGYELVFLARDKDGALVPKDPYEYAASLPMDGKVKVEKDSVVLMGLIKERRGEVSFSELVDLAPAYVMNHSKQIDYVIDKMRSEVFFPTDGFVPWEPLPVQVLDRKSPTEMLKKALNEVIPKLQQGKSFHKEFSLLWIVGDSNAHKSSLMIHLRRFLPVFKPVGASPAFVMDGLQRLPSNYRPAMIWFENLNFRDYLPLYFLETLTDNDRGLMVNVKGSNYMFQRRALIVVTSNYTFKEAYGTMTQQYDGSLTDSFTKIYRAIADQRLYEYRLDRPIDGFPDPCADRERGPCKPKYDE